MSIFNYTIKSKKEAVKTVKFNLWFIYIFSALMLFLFLLYQNFIYLAIGLIYIINAILVKKIMSRTAAFIMTLLSIPIGYMMYQGDVINVALILMIFLASSQLSVATYFFHKKIKPDNVSKNDLNTKILPSNIMNAFMVIYIIFYFEDRTHLLFFDYNHLINLLIMGFLCAISLFIPNLVKKYFSNDKFGKEFYLLSIFSIFILVYSDLPKILHSKTKSNITINAKILKITEKNGFRRHRHTYYTCLIETSESKLNHKKISDIPVDAFHYLKENDSIIIHGELSEYLFKTLNIKFPNEETNKFYQRMIEH